MKLSCPDFSWPLLEHRHALSLITMLGVEGLDLGLFGNRSHVRPETVREDIPLWAGVLSERIARAGLELADFFAQAWTEPEVLAVNHPDPRQHDDAWAFFVDMLELAHRLGTPGMTLLPGVRFGDEPWEASIQRSADALKGRLDAAAVHGITLSVEGHVGSNVDTPEKLARLIELTPGLQLTLDYTHFIYAGFTDADVEPLLEHARHVHCRGGAPGRLQTSFAENVIDYSRILQRLRERAYPGYVGLEYVWSDWLDCTRSDTLSETILFRDFARATIAGSDVVPVV